MSKNDNIGKIGLTVIAENLSFYVLDVLLLPVMIFYILFLHTVIEEEKQF